MQIPTMCRRATARQCRRCHSAIFELPNHLCDATVNLCTLRATPETPFDFLFQIFAFKVFFFIRLQHRILINWNAVSECMNELKYVFRSKSGQSAAFSIWRRRATWANWKCILQTMEIFGLAPACMHCISISFRAPSFVLFILLREYICVRMLRMHWFRCFNNLSRK